MSSGFSRTSTQSVMTWIECYGLYREAGVNQYITIEALQGNTEFVAASQVDIETGLATTRSEKAAEIKYAGQVLVAVGSVILAALSETVAGAVIGALILAVGFILSWFAELFCPPCDKYHCTGYERNTSYRRDKYEEHVKAIVGVQQRKTWDRNDSCACSARDHHCRFVQYIHDGLIMRGPDWEYIESNPANSGEVRGANALTYADANNVHIICNEYWRAYKWESTPIVAKTGNRIPRGGVNYPELRIGYRHEPGPPHNTKYAVEHKLGRDSSIQSLWKAEEESRGALLARQLGSRQAAERALEGKVPFPGRRQQPSRPSRGRRGLSGPPGGGRQQVRRPSGGQKRVRVSGGKQQPVRGRQQPTRGRQGPSQQPGRKQDIKNVPSRKPWDEPWLNGKQTYYFRAWRVQQILLWMMGNLPHHENILCRTMKCMEETLDNTGSVEDDSAFNQKRRRGSRWYSSIVWMMTDIWKAGQHLIAQAKTPSKGWTRFGQILKNSGCSDETLDTLREMAAGKTYGRSNTPWAFFPLMKGIEFTQMRMILMNLKPHFPYEHDAPVLPQPHGEEARATMPVVVPVLTPISFNELMQPIPAKIGSTGPGWGTIMLGLGAAAIGTYALYRVLAPAKE